MAKNITVTNKCAFNWSVYNYRKSALQHIKSQQTLVDTILEPEFGTSQEFVHSQVMSALSERLATFIKSCQASTRTLLPVAAPNMPNNHLPTCLVGAKRMSQGLKPLKLVKLPKFTDETLSTIVDCAYTGYLPTDLKGVWSIMDVASYYEMADVVKACCTFLIKNLDATNCVEYYLVALRHRHEPLRRRAWSETRARFKFILEQNIESLRSLFGFDLLSHKHIVDKQFVDGEKLRNVPNCLASIKLDAFELLLSHDKLNIDNEESVWYSIKIWCAADPVNRCTHLAQLLSCIRFHRLRNGSDFFIRLWREALINADVGAQRRLALLDSEHREFVLRHRLVSTSFASHHLPNNNEPLHDELDSRQDNRRSRANVDNSSYRSALFSRRPRASNQQLRLAAPIQQPQVTGRSQQQQLERDGFGLPVGVAPVALRPRVPNSILLAIGGWQQGTPTTLIESYDSNTNLWFQSDKKISVKLAYHGIECINKLLYICGGTNGQEILNELFTFDVTSGECHQKPSMRQARCYVSTACLGGEYLYAMGGHNGAHRMESAERFDVKDEVWAPISNMNVARSDASAAVHEARIYIAGGLNDQVIESSVEFYNPSDDSWTAIASMLSPRTSFSLLKFKGLLIAIGGNNGTDRLASVEQYNFATKRWSAHSDMKSRRSTCSAAVVDSSKIIVVGGYNGQAPFNKVEMFDSSTNEWIEIQSIRFDRSGLKVVVVNDLPNAELFSYLRLALQTCQAELPSTQHNRL